LQSVRVGHDFEEARRSLREIRATYARKGRHAVYLIEGVPGWLKIGRAASPELRLQNLSAESPFSLRLAHVVWCRSVDKAAELEDRLLGRFDAIRGNGEWVTDLPEVREAFTTLAPLQAEYRNPRRARGLDAQDVGHRDKVTAAERSEGPAFASTFSH
jgi:hypothetical protein